MTWTVRVLRLRRCFSKTPSFLFRSHIPEPDDPRLTACGQGLALRREGNGGGKVPFPLAGELMIQTTGGHIPHHHAVAVASRRKELPVRREGHLAEKARRLAELAQQIPRCNMPQANG